MNPILKELLFQVIQQTKDLDLEWIDHDHDVVIINQVAQSRLPWGFERVVVREHHSKLPFSAFV